MTEPVYTKTPYGIIRTLPTKEESLAKLDQLLKEMKAKQNVN